MEDFPLFSTLSTEEKDKYLRDLKELEQYLINKCNLSIYLTYGTLLGAIREKDFIPHDNDIDLAYLSFFNTQEEVYKERVELMNNLDLSSLIYRKETIGIKIEFNNNKFDLWTSWIDKDNCYNILPYIKIGTKEMITPLKSYEFKGQMFFIPNNSKEWLNVFYRNWEQPIKDSSFRNRHQRFKFLT
jgi:phosphorylcholine metabolism protein LicD